MKSRVWWAAAIALAGCATQIDEPTAATADEALDRAPACADTARYELRGVGGEQFNTLSVDTSILPLSAVGKVLANDQIHMLRAAADDGLAVLDKHVPAYVIMDATGNVTSVESGGFYQCATYADCVGYLTEVIPNYVLDGVAFTARPEFHDSFSGHAYEVVGAAQFQDIPADYAIKITKWKLNAPAAFDPRPLLEALWLGNARHDACARGTLAQAHLAWSPTEQVVAEITIGDVVHPAAGDPTPYFVETLAALAAQPVLDPIFDQLPIFERIAPPVTDTYLVLTYWPGAFDPSRWPNSASTTPGGPLPEPFCGDGSCNQTVTDHETHASCPADCLASCGNGVCDVGETPDTCAIDCLPH